MAESDRKIAVYPHQHDAAYQGDALAPATALVGTAQSDVTLSPLVVSSTAVPTAIMYRPSDDAVGTRLSFQKARGTFGARTMVASGDGIGGLGGAGFDGSAMVDAIGIAFTVDGAPGANDMPGRLTFQTTPDGSAVLANRWTIDQSGMLFPSTHAIYDFGRATQYVRSIYAHMLHLGGPLTPAQLTADTNNYNPSGGTTAYAWRLSTDASRNLNGIAGGISGALHLLVNVGSFDLVLVHESAASNPATRFLCPGSANVTLNPNDSVDIWYDVTSSRWRVKGL